MLQAEAHHFAGDGRFPNSSLPLLVYRRALVASAEAMELHFLQHDWSNAWRDGIYRFHHFHSNAHEVLGIAAGSVTVWFGGPSGRTVAVSAGDVVVIPAGVAHCNQLQSADLLVVGAYPGGAACDIRRGDPHEYEFCRRVIDAVLLPAADPVTGAAIDEWLSATSRPPSS